LTKLKNHKTREEAEDEASGIRTRKVRFTGGGFAFPEPESTPAGKAKKRPSGRDAIIVEGKPGQANIQKPAAESAAAVGRKEPAVRSSHGKKNKTKSANVPEAAAPVPVPTSAVQAGKSAKTAAGKKSGVKQKTAGKKQTKSIVSADGKTAGTAVSQAVPAETAKPQAAEKTAAKSHKKSKEAPVRTEEQPAAVPAPAKAAPAPAKADKAEDMKQRNAGKRVGRSSRRSQPADHKKSRRETAGRHTESSRGGSGEKILECRFSYSGRGFGFAVPVIPDETVGEDIFIAPRASMGAMTGDLVQVRVLHRPSAVHSTEGEVTAVLERTVGTITGRLTVTDTYAAVKPDNEKLRVLVYVPLEDCEMIGAVHNAKVEIVPDGEPYFTRSRSITIERRKSRRGDPYGEIPYFDTKGRITTLFGDAASREANYAAILHASGIRTEFPPYVIQAAKNAAAQPLFAAGRVDNRDKIIFTIDGADAKDLDDAISLEKNSEGDWVLGVHIADVSHYVPYESCVEKEARMRGTSVYFTDKVIPMLPEALSNGSCSLNAGTDRYALSCEITLSPEGRRKHTVIYKSILRSAVRGVYEEVNDLFAKGEQSPWREKYSQVYSTLTDMLVLYRILKTQSAAHGVMELEDAEAKVILDGNGFPVEIVKRERGDAEKMIEQFMLQANMGVAEVLRAKALPCLYRIHEEPDKDKIRNFAVYAHNLGLPTFGLTAQEETGPATLSEKLMAILAEAGKREIGDIVSSVLLRSMMKAKYTAEAKPHFGLGAETYCHFTSPIRRYPDLFVHTVLTAVLPYTPDGRLSAETTLPEEAYPQLLSAAAPERGVSSTDCEINAQSAEWKITDLYMALYMSDKVGQIFDVTVTSVMKFGLFVQCDNLVEGMIPVPLFTDPVVNEAFCTLRSEGALYTLGTRMQARLVEADPASGRITFAPLTPGDAKA